jgi:hypothetical protein
MKHLHKITRTNLPDNIILIKGRMLGLQTGIAMAVFFPASLWPILQYPDKLWHIAIACGVCVITVFLAHFTSSFKIEISPEVVIVAIKYFGITTTKLEYPFDKVIIEHTDLGSIHTMSPPESHDTLTFYFEDDQTDPSYCVSMWYGKKSVRFSVFQRAFEQELWDTLVRAFKDMYAVKGMMENDALKRLVP